MRKKLKWLAGGLKMLSFLIIASVVFISCADDNDGTTDDQDSANVNTTNATAAGEAAAVRRHNNRPDTLPVSAAPKLALLRSDPRHPFGNELIVIIENADTTNAALEGNGYGRWYTIETLPHPFINRNKERLTNTIYGYLSYHDMVVKYPAGPHTLFLKWYEKQGRIDSVVAWIKPAPVITKDTTATLFELSDPPRPRVPPPPAME